MHVFDMQYAHDCRQFWLINKGFWLTAVHWPIPKRPDTNVCYSRLEWLWHVVSLPYRGRISFRSLTVLILVSLLVTLSGIAGLSLISSAWGWRFLQACHLLRTLVCIVSILHYNDLSNRDVISCFFSRKSIFWGHKSQPTWIMWIRWENAN